MLYEYVHDFGWKGNVRALDKVNDSYTGTTFPGGHVERNELFSKSMIRRSLGGDRTDNRKPNTLWIVSLVQGSST